MFLNTRKSLKEINYKMFFALLLSGIFPAIYLAIRVRFLGTIPSDWGFNIASQLSWVNLFYEIANEAIILPAFFLFGAVINNKEQLENRIKTGALGTVIIYIILSIILSLTARPLVIGMAQKSELVNATVDYIRLESIAKIFYILFRFLFPVFILINQERLIYLLLAVQMVLSIIFDTILISSLPISLNMGVNDIAFSNILSNIILVLIGVILLSRKGFKIFGNPKQLSFSWTKDWLRVGGFSGIESLVRNLAFMIVIIRMVNVVQEQGTFWVTNNFIWGWLLLPITALGDLIKRDCAESKNNIKENLQGYVALTSFFVLIWISTIPFWRGFLNTVLGLQDPSAVFSLALISLVFYIIFAYNNMEISNIT